ncbi:MAG: hypothetical protein NZ700_04580, partial [Gemmataceae bacterium]|nr:hypothetical protein [Gemmataceae bacterium]MDW8265633.1 hypothetical protein [Gemmataceae bacterium]
MAIPHSSWPTSPTLQGLALVLTALPCCGPGLARADAPHLPPRLRAMHFGFPAPHAQPPGDERETPRPFKAGHWMPVYVDLAAGPAG